MSGAIEVRPAEVELQLSRGDREEAEEEREEERDQHVDQGNHTGLD